MKRICNLLIVVLMLSLTVAAVGCAARFEVSSLDVSPEVCLPDNTVIVSATLANSGSAKGDYVTELLVNGVMEQTQTFTLEPGSSQPLSFTLMKGEPGGYVVQLGELTASFTVLGVSNLKISPSQVELDQPVTVTADLQNVAETQATYHCCLLCQGKEVEAKDITVPGGSIQEVTFTLSQATSGIHEVELMGLAGSFKVLKPAEFRVISLDLTPNPIKVGGETTISASIENIGETRGTYIANLVVDGVVEQTNDVSLAEGAKKEVSFSLSKDSPGNYEIEIGGQEATLKVVQPVRLETGIILRELPSGEKSRLRIKNGTGLDVVVVLCSSEEPKVPLLVVYVRSDDSHTVMKMREGTYVLYYTLGQDWYEDSQKFLSTATYHQYPDELHFKETSRRYTIWTFDFDSAAWADVYRIGEDEFPVWG